MIVSFRCSPALKEQIDKMVEKGLYEDFSGFCEVALQNQLLLEASHGAEKESASRTSRKERKSKASASPSVVASRAHIELPSESARVREQNDRPEQLRLASLSKVPPFTLPDASSDLFLVGQTVPVDRWLFGQYNRLLPAKVSVRALAAIASRDGRESLLLDSAAARIAEVAAEFGDYLRMLDRKFATHRDDALATAFPETGADGQKGRVRYQNQFVGHTVKGEQGGLLVGLKLASIVVIKNHPYILPTKMGWQLALLSSPALDGVASDSGEKLGADERTFLLQHIRHSVPVEAFAYSVLLKMLTRGVCSPEAMNTELLTLLSAGKPPAEANDLVNTQRSGALGRITDLGLVRHERNGRYVNRVITSEGKKFLEEVGVFRFASVS